jgi:hypothetical protein
MLQQAKAILLTFIKLVVSTAEFIFEPYEPQP